MGSGVHAREIVGTLLVFGKPDTGNSVPRVGYAMPGESGGVMTEQAVEKLSESQIEAGLESHPAWVELNGEIQRTFEFEDFIGAMKFVNQVAEYAERAQHHPDILVRYNKVTLSVSTHDAGGITQKDFDLAEATDKFAG
ncbi:MAG: 4a-hydroxytetrahydrobiopterin dehydratase [Phycisphaerales bacterium]